MVQEQALRGFKAYGPAPMGHAWVSSSAKKVLPTCKCDDIIIGENALSQCNDTVVALQDDRSKPLLQVLNGCCFTVPPEENPFQVASHAVQASVRYWSFLVGKQETGSAHRDE